MLQFMRTLQNVIPLITVPIIQALAVINNFFYSFKVYTYIASHNDYIKSGSIATLTGKLFHITVLLYKVRHMVCQDMHIWCHSVLGIYPSQCLAKGRKSALIQFFAYVIYINISYQLIAM